MKRSDRLKEIEKLWNKKERSDYSFGKLPWEKIQWEPFAANGRSEDEFEFPDVPQRLKKIGHFLFTWGETEEALGWLDWDGALLRGLYTWYILPEDCDAPLFVNEDARAICIPDIRWAEQRAVLFQHPDSVLLGFEHMRAAVQDQFSGVNTVVIWSPNRILQINVKEAKKPSGLPQEDAK